MGPSPRSRRPDGPWLRCRQGRIRPVFGPGSALPGTARTTDPIAGDPSDTPCGTR
ncbi:hypothetical protein ACFPM0_17570 [Pseudonocardia sulfidoxydans]|uniref:hypothetical protein n=1 Tax=Pseudonocardia sulfidoxydans TaxID=54011 RepID=UPI0036198A88